jgi:hypothetical protein
MRQTPSIYYNAFQQSDSGLTFRDLLCTCTQFRARIRDQLEILNLYRTVASGNFPAKTFQPTLATRQNHSTAVVHGGMGVADGLKILFLLADGSLQPFTARLGPKIGQGRTD